MAPHILYRYNYNIKNTIKAGRICPEMSKIFQPVL